MPRTQTRPRHGLRTGLLMAGLLLQSVIWFSPASLLPAMAGELSMTLAQGGLLTSVVCLMAALLGPFSGYFIRRWGIGKAFAVCAGFLCAGAAGSLWAPGYAGLVACRVLVGVGFGLSLSLMATATVEWFPPQRRPFLNSLYAVLPYAATAASYGLSVKLFGLLGGSWRHTLALPGGLLLLLLFLWAVAGRDGQQHGGAPEQRGGYARLVRDAMRDRQVKLICLADACDMCGFQFLSTFLPTYLFQYGGMSLDKASSLTTIFPVTGVAAGLLCGFLMTKSGKRKIFTWTMHLAIFTGTLMIVFADGLPQLLGIAMAGFGNAGWAPALYTMPMEFEGMTEEKVGAVFSLMLSLGYLAAFLSPLLGGALADRLGLRTAMLLLSSFALLAAGLTFCLKETNPA